MLPPACEKIHRMSRNFCALPEKTMSALAAIIPTSRILFGTDFPYRTGIDHVNGLRSAGVFTEAQIADIERNNALKLLPRLGA